MAPQRRRLGLLRRHLACGGCAAGALVGLGPADRAFLDRMGWRCEGQLEYLARALAERGEPVDAEGLHEEGLAQGVQLLKNGHNPYYRNALLSPHADRDWLLGSDSARLAAATNPPCLRNPDAPVQWSAEQWEAMRQRQAAEPLFDWAKVVEQFDRASYERDGFVAFRGIMTPQTAKKWAAALVQCQVLNDRLLLSDFSELDWQAMGVEVPPEGRLSEADIAKALGTAQAWPQRTDEAGVRTLRCHGVIAEYFPIGHVPYLMEVMSHPQMLALQRLCFNCPKEDLFFGQVNLNSKKPGHEGGGWHSHWTGGGTDGVGQPNIAGSVEDFMQENLQNLNLTYPAGVGADSGAINVIPGTPLAGSPLFPLFGMVASWVAPTGSHLCRWWLMRLCAASGSHLYRDPDNCRGADLGSHEDDSSLDAEVGRTSAEGSDGLPWEKQTDIRAWLVVSAAMGCSKCPFV